MTNITILHGDNVLKSRQAKIELINTYRKQGFDIEEIQGDKTTALELSTLLATSNLFSDQVVAIDNIFSRLKSKEKDACLKLLSQTLQKPLIIWEKKELSPTALKPFVSIAKITVFKETNTLFPFIDSLYPGNTKKMLDLFHTCLKDNDIMLIFGMVVRRVTDILIALDDPSALKGSPWGIKIVTSQARKWQSNQALKFHQTLLKIDLATKSGNTKLDLASQLDLLFLQF